MLNIEDCIQQQMKMKTRPEKPFLKDCTGKKSKQDGAGHELLLSNSWAGLQNIAILIILSKP